MTVHAAIAQAIRERLAANWTTTPIKYPNTGNPAGEPPFVYLQVRFVSSRQISIGTGSTNRRFRQTGLIIIGIYVEKNIGEGLADQYADSIAAIFRGQTFDGVVCLAPTPDAGRPADDQGNYWLKTLTCEFYSDTLA